MLIKDNLILDDEGRTLILRGVNLGGDSKIPFCKTGDEIHPSFLDRKNEVSFTGRPFPLEEAESHFKRLKNSGMTFLRLIVTWEAIEHEGPGIYDEAYLAYLRKILLAAEKEGVSVFIDPHQDVWSRWTGGDGAPAWTMEKLGMNMDLFDCSGVAITRQHYSLYNKSKKHPNGKPYPKMLWPSNYNRYVTATMFSLFYAGRTFAPELQVDGENIQDWLQNRYIAAFRHAQRRLKNCSAIAGWGTMNEPHNGFISHQNLELPENTVIPVGEKPSPWDSIRAASGHTVKIPVYNMISFGKKIDHYKIINPEGLSIFREGFCCPWKQAGIWKEEGGKPELVKKDHFSNFNGRCPVFAEDFLKPFLIKYINVMKEADDRSLFFIEGLPNCIKEDSHPTWSTDEPSNAVNAFHWYDGFSLFTKSFHSWFTVNVDTAKLVLGKKRTGRYFAECLSKGLAITRKKMGNVPSLLGEFGLAFDLNNRSGLKKDDYSLHEEALSMYYDAIDVNMLHSTIWNYSASNTKKYGDSWNDEDLSIFSEGRERAAAGWKRPYPMATAGKPLFFKWDRKKKVFVFNYNADANIKAPSEVFLPAEILGDSPVIKITPDIRHEYKDQKLMVYNDGYNSEVKIAVRLR
jgi:hypothetical protein